MNALVSLDSILEPAQALTATSLFGSGQVETILAAIEKDVRAELFDVDTEEGRERIKSVAYKVARSKTTLDEIGKEHVAHIKAQSAAIDKERKTLRDRLDSLKDEVRAPLTAWEQAEEQRIADHARCLAILVDATRFVVPPTAEMVRERFAEIAYFSARDWQEFGERAEAAYTDAKAKLDAMEEAAEQRERDQAELDALRKEKAERDEQDRANAEAKARAEAERIRTEQQAERERLHAEQRERDQAAAEERAKRQAEEAAARAVEQERQRVAAATAAAEAAERKRQENKRHREKVQKAIIAALVASTGATEDHAYEIVCAIADARVPHVSINY